jgi:hypothetical protein
MREVVSTYSDIAGTASEASVRSHISWPAEADATKYNRIRVVFKKRHTLRPAADMHCNE